MLHQINTRTHRLARLLKQAPLALPDPKPQCFHAVRLKTLRTSSKISAIKMTSVGKLMRVFSVNFFLHTQKMMQRRESHPPHRKYCMIRLFYQVPPNAREREALYSAPFCRLVRDFKRFGVPCWPNDQNRSPLLTRSGTRPFLSCRHILPDSFAHSWLLKYRNCGVKLINPWQTVKSTRLGFLPGSLVRHGSVILFTL